MRFVEAILGVNDAHCGWNRELLVESVLQHWIIFFATIGHALRPYCLHFFFEHWLVLAEILLLQSHLVILPLFYLVFTLVKCNCRSTDVTKLTYTFPFPDLIVG